MIKKVQEPGRGIVAIILIAGILYAIFDWGSTNEIYGFSDPILGVIEPTARIVFGILGVASFFALFMIYNRVFSPWKR